jgi:hypothetical protein
VKINCSRHILRQFRKECREHFPNEHFAAIYGVRSPEGNILITKIAPVFHEGSAHQIDVTEADIYRSKRAALRKDEDWIGTIHSHCDTKKDPVCWHLSNVDIRSALAWGEAICGVVFVDDDGRRTEVNWYVPSPIPEVVYD